MRPVLAFLAALPLAALAAAGPIPPKPAHYVTDGAGVLDPARAAALDAKLAEFERRTSSQVLVWIAPRVPEGITMEELGAEAIRAWGVGQKGKDNGAVLFVFTEPRRTRLATGYGLEGAIPDVAAKRILVDLVRPHVQRGDFDLAVEAGTDAILQLAGAEGYAGTGKTVAETGPEWLGAAGWVLVVALLVVAYGRRSILLSGIAAALGVVGVVGLIEDFTPAAVGMQAIVLTLFAPVAFIVLVVQAFSGDRGRPRPSSSPDPGWSPAYDGSGSSSDGWSSDSSSSSSSSDFDGGGGDSGGGGASDGGSSSDD
jgi:uncharacterized protein